MTMATRPVSPACVGGAAAPSAPTVPADSRRKSRLDTVDLAIGPMIALSDGVSKTVLTVPYLWRRNIWVNMLAHFVVDAAAFLA
jgi:hypothetical protein